ncbi:helix-turn-helix domain-containing protein [Ornithinimicrobium cryptoxanthini]|uniref:helix-turn-helix domain-containing protein n=1 Tax=Ornithinimicrobium cryptoxanthini TaxID=2934161 RepID=UPI00211746FA|nr:helix-turn-helix domain-containing protein [Ornithinimicrobium cryptoxanthini]
MGSTQTRVTPQDIPVEEAQRLREQAVRALTLRLGDSELELSDGARGLLVEMFDRLAKGESVLVVSADEMLSTQQAADLLRVSRPTLVKMLEDGVLPFERPGTHRRVSRRALQEFLDDRAERRARALEEFAATEDPSDTDDYVTTR